MLFYKVTNSHFYFNYYSHHPQHIKDNLPYGLAKKIIAFDRNRMQFRLNQMKNWLLKCNYPLKIINKGFHNVKLQGPAPEPHKDVNKKLIFTSKYVRNYSHTNTVHQISSILKKTKSKRPKTKDQTANYVICISKNVRHSSHLTYTSGRSDLILTATV